MTMPTDRPDAGLRAKLRELRDDCRRRAKNCINYIQQHKREGAEKSAQFHDGAAQAFSDTADRLDTLLAQASAEPSASGAIPPSEGPQPRPDVRRIVEALGFDPTNHHNALVCAYCNPDRLALVPLPGAAAPSADDLLAAANRNTRDLDPDLAPVVNAILHAVGGYGQGFKVQAILRAWIAGLAAAPSEDAK